MSFVLIPRLSFLINLELFFISQIRRAIAIIAKDHDFSRRRTISLYMKSLLRLQKISKSEIAA
jgi:hypothetical protein